MGKTKKRSLKKLKEVPDRFKNSNNKNDDIYFLQHWANETKPPELKDYVHIGTGNGGYYFIKS